MFPLSLQPLIKQNYRLITKAFPSLGCGSWKLTGRAPNRTQYKSTADLIEDHFSRYSEENHICRPSLTRALELLGGKPACIVETGSSAWGTNSSLLFDSYVANFGGTFETVDIRVRPSIELEPLCSAQSTLYCDDSVQFLKKWSSRNPSKKIDLLYLDSWDVDWSNPDPSALHGLAECISVLGHLKPTSLLLIDDTPVDANVFKLAQTNQAQFDDYCTVNGFPPGKGALCKPLLKSLNRGEVIMHRYQLLWQF
jgi:hypothetical protein